MDIGNIVALSFISLLVLACWLYVGRVERRERREQREAAERKLREQREADDKLYALLHDEQP